MGRKYLASLLAVAMFAAGVPCAQAEELEITPEFLRTFGFRP